MRVLTTESVGSSRRRSSEPVANGVRRPALAEVHQDDARRGLGGDVRDRLAGQGLAHGLEDGDRRGPVVDAEEDPPPLERRLAAAAFPRRRRGVFARTLFGTRRVSPLRVSIAVCRQAVSRTRPDVSPNFTQSPGPKAPSSWRAMPPMTFARVSWSEKPMTAVTTAEVATMPVTSTWWTEKSQRRRATNESPTARSRAMRGNPHPARRQEEVEDERRRRGRGRRSPAGGGARKRMVGAALGSSRRARAPTPRRRTETPKTRTSRTRRPRASRTADEEERRPEEEGGPEPDRFRRKEGEGRRFRAWVRRTKVARPGRDSRFRPPGTSDPRS